MSISDLAAATDVSQVKLIDLEIHQRDALTDEERQRLVDLVAVVEVG